MRRSHATWVAGIVLGQASSAWAQIVPHTTVRGAPVTTIEIVEEAHAPRRMTWEALAGQRLSKGRVRVRFEVPAGPSAVEVPVCAGRLDLWVDGARRAMPPGPFVSPLNGTMDHVVEFEVSVGAYEHRLACSSAPRAGETLTTSDELGLLTFGSPHAAEGGGHAVVFVPPGHDRREPSALLVGLHPWNGGIWTYAAYAELLAAARDKDIVLLMPSGLGNSLYTANAEDEVLRAIEALSAIIRVDSHRVSIWGASMGGAGATTVCAHRPDAFATVTSFFGDSKYDLATYVRTILHDEGQAHLVNALDVADNFRNVPVWLVHGDDDRVSSPAQSEMLAQRLASRGFTVRFNRVPHAGHEGSLVSRFAAEMVERAARARVPDIVSHVTYTSVRKTDNAIYGIRFVRTAEAGDASIDLERRDESVHLLRASGVRAVALPRGAFGFAPNVDAPIVFDDPTARGVAVVWDALP